MNPYSGTLDLPIVDLTILQLFPLQSLVDQLWEESGHGIDYFLENLTIQQDISPQKNVHQNVVDLLLL
jgi:hypothetical protein